MVELLVVAILSAGVSIGGSLCDVVEPFNAPQLGSESVECIGKLPLTIDTVAERREGDLGFLKLVLTPASRMDLERFATGRAGKSVMLLIRGRFVRLFYLLEEESPELVLTYESEDERAQLIEVITGQ